MRYGDFLPALFAAVMSFSSGIAGAAAPVPDFCRRGSVVLFQGDSLTHGSRHNDMNHVYGHGFMKAVAAVNEALGAKIRALNDSALVRLSLWDRFVGPDGEIPPELMFDALHPTAKGYDIWGEALQRTLGLR